MGTMGSQREGAGCTAQCWDAACNGCAASCSKRSRTCRPLWSGCQCPPWLQKRVWATTRHPPSLYSSPAVPDRIRARGHAPPARTWLSARSCFSCS